MKYFLSIGLGTFACLFSSTPVAADELTAYIGTYTQGDSKGIYHLHVKVDSNTLKSAKLELAAETTNPSFVALHPDGKHLYAVGEFGDFNGQKSGAASAFAIQEDGSLKQIRSQPSHGRGACHLVVDHSGKHVLVANYGGGNVASLPIRSDGSLGQATSVIQHDGSSINPRRQKGPHAHSINVDPTNKFAMAADLGIDKIMIYKFDAATGQLSPNDPAFVKVKPGSGPRHFAFHPNGKFAFVINELLLTVTAFDFDSSSGKLTPRQTISTLPKGEKKTGSTAEIQVHPNGKFVYGSNRGHDSIVVYIFDEATGQLKYVANEPIHGQTPRNFGIDPTGKYLLACGQKSGTITVFRIDQSTGRLQKIGEPIKAPTPVCVKFVP